MSKKILSVICVIVVIITSMPISLAINCDNISNITINNSGPVTTYSTSKPGTAWNWSKGSYHFEGQSFSQPLYSNYLFTNASKVRITACNDAEKEVLTVKLLKKQIGVDWSVSTKKIKHGETLSWQVEIDSSREYILMFQGTHANFYGTISRVAA